MNTELAIGLGLVATGAVAAGLGSLMVKSGWEKSTKPPVVQTTLQIDCVQSRLPEAAGPDGLLWTVNLWPVPESRERLGLGRTVSAPGTPYDWPEEMTSDAFRCTVRNLGEVALINVELELKASFYTAPEGLKPARTEGRAAAERTWPVRIDRLEPKGEFTFYGYTISRYFVHATIPERATGMRVDRATSEPLRLFHNIPAGGLTAGPNRH